ncbi:hypothetical protein [Paenibacillus alkalitolerans]|uniref:hypothetical protein n=1 Tax=Paenibacillus alkalitolerans TaxID=2799335 RepID=UPI0018F46815|nr:hypothetical protein [Paenibacillus alkalitolerans]
MGVKFNREYKDIINDMVYSIGSIADCHECFEMSRVDWDSLDGNERTECIRTLADDIFYGLGSSPRLAIGSGKVEYDPDHHLIKVYPDPKIVHVIKLI